MRSIIPLCLTSPTRRCLRFQHKLSCGLIGRYLVLIADPPALGILQEGLFDRLWQFQENEALRWIKVIFAAFVYYS